MKNLLTKSFLILAVVCFGFSANAQELATLNSTHTLKVGADANIEFAWTAIHSVSGTVITSTDAIAKDNSVELTFTEVGLWNITVQGKDKTTLCLTEPMLTSVKVFGTASVMFADAAANADMLTCSLLDGDTANVSDFEVVFTDGVAPFELTYKTIDKDGTESALLTKSFGTAGATSPVTGTISLSDFENTTLASQETSIHIVSALTADNTAVDLSTTASDLVRKITVRTKPVITDTISFE
ncbi:hypothetical protein [Ancylomarina sp. 16SWW S1-10-2]|uniref:hypothetical protein n=1 Tax=Ancylomarina sp. 16SWW S1-10-2 TaxID=2499681 RepID=UPI0012ADFC72|nr:hypothetical protein [Ancylomarina sp. 16SWW S1-10-2]MRT94534.1 hypothetical protein [Ancylomarina sp. 16SWW S1-10-2]